MKTKLILFSLALSSTLCLSAPTDKKLEILPNMYIKNTHVIRVNEPGHVFISQNGGVTWNFFHTFYYTPNYFVTTNNSTITVTLFKHLPLNKYH